MCLVDYEGNHFVLINWLLEHTPETPILQQTFWANVHKLYISIYNTLNSIIIRLCLPDKPNQQPPRYNFLSMVHH